MTIVKVYSTDDSQYTQSSVSKRIEALFLNNIGMIVTRDQIIRASTDPKTGKQPENWHQRLSELRTDKGYTILTNRDTLHLKPQEYLMENSQQRASASRRVLPNPECWKAVLANADQCCQWSEDGHMCRLKSGDQDPIGGGTVKLTADHMIPHSLDPATDPTDPSKWQALCGRHQVMKKNFWDSSTGKFNIQGVLQAASRAEKKLAYDFLRNYFEKNNSQI